MNLLQDLLEKGKDALKQINNIFVEKAVTRSYDRCVDNILAMQGRAEKAKNALYEKLVASDEDDMVEIYKQLAQKMQEIDDCNNTIVQLEKVKKELFGKKP